MLTVKSKVSSFLLVHFEYCDEALSELCNSQGILRVTRAYCYTHKNHCVRRCNASRIAGPCQIANRSSGITWACSDQHNQPFARLPCASVSLAVDIVNDVASCRGQSRLKRATGIRSRYRHVSPHCQGCSLIRYVRYLGSVVPLNLTIFHKLSQAAGYGETHGEDKVLSDFQKYLAWKEISPSKLKATNEHISEFLDYVTGQRQPSDDEDSGEVQILILNHFTLNA